MIRALLGLGLLGLVVLAGAGAWVHARLTEPLPVRETQVFEIRSGASLAGVADDLAERGVLPHPVLWRWWGRISGQAAALHTGEYAIEPGVSALALLDRFAAGGVLRRSLTFVEGWRFVDFRALLDAQTHLRHVTRGLDDAEVMTRLGEPQLHPEGRFFPDTYDYTKGDSDLDILIRARARMREVLQKAWSSRSPLVPYTDPDEALILASLVEKETGVDADRPLIAAVFVRRLERNMRLQTDPAVIYGLGEDFDGDLRRRDLRAEHPYNTYRYGGLPPTPIAMPGAASIRAALQPAETDALYFVARGDGSSQFSATLEEHQAAVRRFQIQQRSTDYRSAPTASKPESTSP